MNLNLILKSLVLNILTYCTFIKINNKKRINIITKLTILIVSALETCVYMLLRKYVSSMLTNMIIFFIQLIFLKLIFYGQENLVITSNLIANSMIYLLFTVSTLIEAILMYTIQIESKLLNLILILMIEIIMLIVFFKFKRFKNGFSFLQNKANGEYLDIIMINISSAAMILYCLFANDSGKGEVVKQVLIPLILSGIIMIIMIQKTLTLYYKQKLLEKDITEYENTIKEKDTKIEELSKEKFEISKLNHEFYNRQKALQLKVENIISNMSLEISDKLSVMNQINKLSKEYTGKLEDIKHTDKLPLTDIEEIDDIFKYMQNECKKNNIEFQLTINGNIRHMVNKIIPKEKLATLIGDHIRDAIIAICCSDNKFRSIVVVLEPKDKIYELSISDTGIEFEAETFAKLGLEPATTHKDRGGNGIGFITTFETLRETRGSLIIEERHPMQENDFTKTVIFRFDGKNEYKICTYRPEEIKDPNNRMIIENINEK